MLQVITRIRWTVFGWFPDGIPIYGFGLMLFLAFIVCNWLTGRRAARMIQSNIGLGRYVAGPKQGEIFPGGDKVEAQVEAAKALVQDAAIWLFVTGLVGARLTYMMYHRPRQGWEGFWAQLVDITNGGIILYGSVIGALVGYALFCGYIYVRHQAVLNTLRIADLAAPAVALGIGIGRIGCLLNGCCYGHVACADCHVSYYAVQFPFSAPPRDILIDNGYQTAAGFTLESDEEQSNNGVFVGVVDPHSLAARAGLANKDLITAVNGKSLVVYKLTERSLAPGGDRVPESVLAKLAPLQGRNFESVNALDAELQTVLTEEEMKDYEAPILHRARYDSPKDLLYRALFPDWKRGDKDLTLTVVDRTGNEKQLTFKQLTFRPLTLGLYPTQAFETISMLLLFLLLLAFFAYRSRDGQVMALLMMCYAVHRTLNELLRADVRPVGFEAYSSYILFVAGAALMVWATTRPRQYVSEWELK
jgi:prolipoprotein diacylglyceryltransferase